MSKKKYADVIKPNSIAEARGTMSKSFLDILDISLYEVAMDNETPDRLEYRIDTDQFSDKFGLKIDKSSFRKLRLSVKNALKNSPLLTLTIDDEGHEVDYFIFQEIEYIESEHLMIVMFTKRFKNYLVTLLKRKGKKIYYSLPDTLQMNSEYTKKLYPILLERVSKSDMDRMTFSANGSQKGKLFDTIYSIDKFKSVLNIPASYMTSNIKSTCNLIVAEIEAYTPYHAEVYYNEAKSGRGRPKTTHVCFRMVEKHSKKIFKAPVEVSVQETAAIDVKDSNMDVCIKAVASAAKEVKIKLTDKNIADIAKSASITGLSENDIRARILYEGQNAGHVKNIVGYLRFVVSDRYDTPKEVYLNGYNIINRDNDYDIDEIIKQRTIDNLSNGSIDSRGIDDFLAEYKE